MISYFNGIAPVPFVGTDNDPIAFRHYKLQKSHKRLNDMADYFAEKMVVIPPESKGLRK